MKKVKRIDETKENKIIDKMAETVGFIRDAKKNADAFYSAEAITNNMNQYFGGLQYVFYVLTGRDIHWGFDGTNYRLIEITTGREVTIKTIENP